MNNAREYFERLFTEQVKRPGAAELLEWLRKSDFYDAPASTRFHLACPGGLVEHSLHVYERLKQLCECETLNNPAFKAPPTESVAIVGLLHDICKVGVYIQEPKNQKTYDPQKVAAASSYQVKHDQLGDFVWETVMGYRFEDSLCYGHGEASVYIISGFMKLTREEAMAIRWHMGFSDDSFRAGSQLVGKAFEKYPLAVLTHMADLQATYMDDKNCEV